MTSIAGLLKNLDIQADGSYDNQFYVVNLKDSNDYARMYTKLEKNAINTENPSFGVNSANNTTKVTTYFTVDYENITYNLFLIADFDKEKYYLKIGEK